MTKIEWADMTINPVLGCSKCSPGCDNCYAEKMAYRLSKNPKTATKYFGVVDNNGKWTGEINVDYSVFDCLPKKPQHIFVGSMCDLFHEEVSPGTTANIITHTQKYKQHIFMFLTKRPRRMRQAMNLLLKKPFDNLWLGVTVCNQQEADEKIPFLLRTPAAKRFVSIEPMLGAVNLSAHLLDIDWIICGGETGPKARPMHPDWVRDLRDQCAEADVPFFFKGWGEWGTNCADMRTGEQHFKMFESFDHYCNKAPTWMRKGDKLICPDGHIPTHGGSDGKTYPMCIISRIGKRRSGRLLDGAEHNYFPE